MEVNATILGLEGLKGRLDDATRDIVGDIAHLIQAGGMRHAPVGTAGNTTNMPGDLRRSIVVEGPEQVGPHTWRAEVGPTMIYSRQRELGGAIYPKRASFLRFVRFGEVHYRKRVYQHPEPYMKPAEMEAKPAVQAIAYSKLAVVIRGG